MPPYSNAQQMYMQQIQGMVNQLNGLMQQANSLPMQEPVYNPALQTPAAAKEPREVKYVHGADGAREEQRKLQNGESEIVMDDANPLFYMISKDKDGKSPRRIPIGRFTLEDEPDPPKYVTQEDLAAFKADLLNAIKGDKK